eukprot:1149669-Pelagomonas_calceolata.AAC.7
MGRGMIWIFVVGQANGCSVEDGGQPTYAYQGHEAKMECTVAFTAAHPDEAQILCVLEGVSSQQCLLNAKKRCSTSM